MKTKKTGNMTFQQAVESTPDIANGFKKGLSALGTYRTKILVADTRLIEGSVDIDTCTTAKYPNSNRWDYAFAYNKEVLFIEVHTANTREVSTVLRKLQWLKDWLLNQAPEIDKIKVKDRTPYYWIQSNGFHILPQSSEYRRLAQKGLMPISKLQL